MWVMRSGIQLFYFLQMAGRLLQHLVLNIIIFPTDQKYYYFHKLSSWTVFIYLLMRISRLFSWTDPSPIPVLVLVCFN